MASNHFSTAIACTTSSHTNESTAPSSSSAVHQTTLDVDRPSLDAAVKAENVDSDAAANTHIQSQQAIMTAPGGKNKKKARIPRPMNSFMVFGKEQRKLIQQEHPDLDNKAVSKVLGQRWRSLTDEDRQKYVDEAQRLADEHRILYPDWKFTRETKRKEKKGKKEPRQRKSQSVSSPKPTRSKTEPLESEGASELSTASAVTTTAGTTAMQEESEDVPPSYTDAMTMQAVDADDISQLHAMYSESASDTVIACAADYGGLFTATTTSDSLSYPSGSNTSLDATISHQRHYSLPDDHHLRYGVAASDDMGMPRDGYDGPPRYCHPPSFADAIAMIINESDLIFSS
eukprot:TRINITY_DN9566_c0_g1_i1.p1 TRINITY_DN9566_c0_g1~~TRINITY_DN9566_c0_g1_i1.p1  ORF type:complete len:344 (+),score=78.43 TRINITY_DN9566_c0_g1_i1:1154-2185(+)